MTALAISIAFLGALAFAAYVLHLRTSRHVETTTIDAALVNRLVVLENVSHSLVSRVERLELGKALRRVEPA
jgi:hypothetical protein